MDVGFGRIVLVVLAVHLCIGLYILTDWRGETRVHELRKPVQVRTVVPVTPVVKSVPALAPAPAVKPAAAPPSPPKKAPAAPKPAAPTKPAAKPVAKPAPKPAQTLKPSEPKPAGPTLQQQAIAQAQEQLRQLDAPLAALSQMPNLSLPSLPEMSVLPTEPMVQAISAEVAYEQELMGRLKLLLKLPEYGKVRVRMKVRRDGTVGSVEIVNAESRLNRTYVEAELPRCRMPQFGPAFGQEPDHTFVVLLSNAI